MLICNNVPRKEFFFNSIEAVLGMRIQSGKRNRVQKAYMALKKERKKKRKNVTFFKNSVFYTEGCRLLLVLERPL